jgi:hypothetical protein
MQQALAGRSASRAGSASGLQVRGPGRVRVDVGITYDAYDPLPRPPSPPGPQAEGRAALQQAREASPPGEAPAARGRMQDVQLVLLARSRPFAAVPLVSQIICNVATGPKPPKAVQINMLDEGFDGARRTERMGRGRGGGRRAAPCAAPAEMRAAAAGYARLPRRGRAAGEGVEPRGRLGGDGARFGAAPGAGPSCGARLAPTAPRRSCPARAPQAAAAARACSRAPTRSCAAWCRTTWRGA